MARPLAYITAVWSDEPHEAKEEALRFSRQVYDAGYSPICPSVLCKPCIVEIQKH